MNRWSKLKCFFGHDMRLGPYAHSDHMVDTSFCFRCKKRWGLGWAFVDGTKRGDW